MLTVTAIAADHLSSTFTNYIRAMANYRDCPQTTHKSHSLHISEWQLSHGKQTVDFSEPTGTNRQKEQFKLDSKSKI